MVLTGRRVVVAALLAAGIASIGVAFSGCRLLSFGPKAGGFSHRLHARRGITCDSCHPGAGTEAAAGMPTYGTCQVCHGATAHREAYPYELEIQRVSPAAAFVVRPGRFDLKFSHAGHAREVVSCSVCHGDVASRDEAAPEGPLAEICAECHRRKGVSRECSLCHSALSATSPPRSHQRGAWMRTHGREAVDGSGRGHRESCGLCHVRSQCDGCHQVEKPQGHGEFFRRRGHGLLAAMDRERCATCHQENFCVRCHRESRPRSHGASWGGARSYHCLACHDPLERGGCSVCHRGTPSHSQATPLPGPPHPPLLSDCRRCHLRAPHAEGGGDCTACHR